MNSGWIISFNNGYKVILNEASYKRYQKETPKEDVIAEAHWFDINKAIEENPDLDLIETDTPIKYKVQIEIDIKSDNEEDFFCIAEKIKEAIFEDMCPFAQVTKPSGCCESGDYCEDCHENIIITNSVLNIQF